MVPTQEMWDRYEAWLGQMPEPMRQDLRTDDPEWMHPADAVAIVVTLGTLITDPAERQEARLALRTHASLSRHQRRRWVAEWLGVSLDSVKQHEDPTERGERAARNGGATSLYRHFDSAGTLLYIGIAKDPFKRFDTHKSQSAWHPYSADMTIEWFDTRGAALDAERRAIRDERPIFNVMSSDRSADDAEDYLMAREFEIPPPNPLP